MSNEKLRFLQRVFGNTKLQINGVELNVRCPKCTPANRPDKLKMNIRIDNDLYHCWVCDFKGRNLGRLIKMYDRSAVQEYYDKFSNYKFVPIEKESEPVELPKDFRLVMESLWDPEALQVRNYCNSRGISDTLLWRYRVGYSSEFKFRRRAILPSFDRDGKLNYWTARSIDSDNDFKYMNAKASKKEIIFNDIDIDWESDYLFIVEGPLDLVKCSLLNSTSILGSRLSVDTLLFQEIVRNGMDVVLSFDPDAWKKQTMTAQLLSSYGIDVFFANTKTGDVGDLNPNDVVNLYSNKVLYNSQFGMLKTMIERM